MILEHIFPDFVSIVSDQIGKERYTASYFFHTKEKVYQFCPELIKSTPEEVCYNLAASIYSIYPNILDDINVLNEEGEIIRTFSLTFLWDTYSILFNNKDNIMFTNEDDEEFQITLDED